MSANHQAREAAPAMEAAPSTYAQEQTTDSNDRLQRLISVTHIGSGPMSISRDLMVADALEEILSGHYASEIANLRDEIVCCGRDSEQVKNAKLVLPAYLLSGRVEGKVAQAMNEGRFYHAGLLQLDFDKLEDPAATRDMIIQDPHVLASWISPSGDGVKGLQVMDLAATEAEHLAAFQSAEAYWQARGLTLDTACKNSNRLCFASHDPDLRWKEDAIPLRVDSPPPPPPKAAKPQVEGSPKSPKIVLSETHSPREITAEDARAMLAAIPPRPEYSQWLRIASAVWDAVGESAGTALLNAWSPEERPGEYAGKFSDRLTQVRAGTLVMLAKDHGWTSPSQKSTHTDKGNIPEAEQDDCRAILTKRAFDAATVPQRPIPILLLGDKVICTPGNIMNIQAGVKAGKSAVVGAIIAAMFNGNRQGADTLGFSADNSEGRAVLHFDTEQSRFDHDALIRRAMTRARVDAPPPWFHSYCLTDLDIHERRQVIEYAIVDAAEEHDGIFGILIDGVADICVDLNNPEEAFGLVGGLQASAIKHECAFITVIHENPGSEIGKTRGHLGSQLERKAETPLRLAKDASSGMTTIWADRARHCHIPKERGTCFSWCDKMEMHVSRGSAGEIKASEKRQKFVKEAEAAFEGEESLSYSALVKAIMRATGLKSDKTAERRVTTYQAEGVVIKTPSGSYALKS